MRKLLSAVVSGVLVWASLFAAASAVFAESKFDITEDAVIAERIQAFADIKALFTDQTDLVAVKAMYEDKFQEDVLRIDATIQPNDPKIDESITLVLDSAIAGDLQVGQARQAVDKGLQWYFYFSIRDLVNRQVRPAMTAGDTATARAAFDKAVQIYEGALETTVGRRDQRFGLDMAGILQGTIEQLLTDIDSGNANDFNVHRQVLDKTLIKMFLLATMTYAETIPTRAPADQPTALSEGYFFFMSIYTYLRGGSETDANYVRDAFGSGDPGRINTAAIQAALHRTLIGKVSEYVNQAFVRLESGDLQGARGYAMEGNMFAVAQEVFLGKEKYDETIGYAQQFADAVDRSDLESAKRYGFAMLKHMAPLDGAQLTLNDKTYYVNGEARTTDSAPFLNAETGRTLVPVRLIADTLAANVSFDAATRTVSITKDGSTTELAVGSQQVKQNGAVSESITLDQPLLIVDGRSFIPLRAVAELFGKGVFYDSGNIIILR